MRETPNMARVGLTVLLALVVLAAAILVIGERSFLFTRTSEYFILFESVSGLDQGSPVQLNGVVVGRVGEIVLSSEIEETLLQVWIEIESKYTSRIRTDSIARIKSLGLLGDKYVQLVSGSADQPVVEPGGEIPAAQPTDVDSLIRSGEDVADYVVSTARSLTAILGRLERGEGLVGELLTDQRGQELTLQLEQTLDSIRRVADRVDSGEGAVARLLTDEQLADRIATSVDRVENILDQAQNGDGPVARLLSDEEAGARIDGTLRDMETAVSDLAEVARTLKERQGLAHRLVYDEDWATQLLERLDSVVANLDQITGEIATGEGSAARFINDPQLYEAVNDIVVGVNESRMLRWLIRNRQKAGIETRYEDERARLGADDGEIDGDR